MFIFILKEEFKEIYYAQKENKNILIFKEFFIKQKNVYYKHLSWLPKCRSQELAMSSNLTQMGEGYIKVSGG